MPETSTFKWDERGVFHRAQDALALIQEINGGRWRLNQFDKKIMSTGSMVESLRQGMIRPAGILRVIEFFKKENDALPDGSPLLFTPEHEARLRELAQMPMPVPGAEPAAKMLQRMLAMTGKTPSDFCKSIQSSGVTSNPSKLASLREHSAGNLIQDGYAREYIAAFKEANRLLDEGQRIPDDMLDAFRIQCRLEFIQHKMRIELEKTKMSLGAVSQDASLLPEKGKPREGSR